MLNLGDFDGVFINAKGGVDVAKGPGRYFVGQFEEFAAVRHLISGREDLITNMDCAGYALKQDTPTKFVFRSRAAREAWIMRRKIRMQDPQQPDQALSPITEALAVDVFGLVLAPSFLRAVRSIPLFGNSEIRRERLFARYQQKYQQNGRLPRTFACIFNVPRKFFWEIRN